MMVKKVSDLLMCIKQRCSNDVMSFSLSNIVYNCQGSWTENTTTFIVATHSGSQHAVCISYQPIDATNVRLFVGDSCYRSIPLQISDHHLAANLTVIGEFIQNFLLKTKQYFLHEMCFSCLFSGKCTDVSSASTANLNWNLLHTMLLFTIIALIKTR